MKLVKVLGASWLAVFVAGCAQFPVASPEVQVQARAQASWKARLAGNFEEAYQFTEPSFRQEVSYEQYRNSFGGATRWVGADIVSVTCDQQKCLVKMSIVVPSPVPHQFSGNITTRVDESWVFADGQWWVVPKR